MKNKAYRPDKIQVLLSKLIIPIVIVMLTWLGFNAIFYYYAPYGRFIISPLNKLSEPLNLVIPVEVWDETNVIQPFVAEANGLEEIDLQVVTWGDRDRPHNVFWHLNEIGKSGTKILKLDGKFRATKAKDWEFVKLKFKPIVNSKCKLYEVVFSAPGTPQSQSIGFPIYKTQEPPIAERMSKILSGTLKDTAIYSQGTLRGSGHYFYEKFG